MCAASASSSKQLPSRGRGASRSGWLNNCPKWWWMSDGPAIHKLNAPTYGLISHAARNTRAMYRMGHAFGLETLCLGEIGFRANQKAALAARVIG